MRKVNQLLDEEGKDRTTVVGQQLVVDESKQRPIVSGWYCTEDGRTTSVAHWLDEDDLSQTMVVL